MIRTTIYQILAQDGELTKRLAPATPEMGIGNNPGIYETWAGEAAPMPYINLTYAFYPSDHPVKRRGVLNIDLFFDGYDSTIGEEINNRIVQLLDQHLFHDPDDGAIRIYLDNEVQLPTDEENISHWNLTFTLITWRRSFIAARPEWDL